MNHSWYAYRLANSSDHMVLHMAWLDMMRIARNEWRILGFLVFKTDLPAIQQLRPSLDVCQLRILRRALQLSTDDVFQAIIRDYVMMGTLVLNRNGLFHQPALLKLVAVDQGAAEASLLIRSQALGKVGVDLVRGVCFTRQ